MNRSFTSFLFIVVAVHCCLFWCTETDAAGPIQCYDKSGPAKPTRKNRTCAIVANGKMGLCDTNKGVKKHCPVLCNTCGQCRDSDKSKVVTVGSEKKPCSYLEYLNDNKFQKLCRKYGVGSKCPDTCGTCHDGCQDNPNEFKFNKNGGKKKCSDADAKPTLCKNKTFKRNCKKKCEVCVITPTPAPSPGPTPTTTLPPTKAPSTPAPTNTDPTSTPTVPQTLPPTNAPNNGNNPTTDPTFNPTKAPTNAPTEAPTSSINSKCDRAVGIFIGGGAATFVSCNDGTLQGAGGNEWGQLGTGSTSGRSGEPNPQDISLLPNVDVIDTGSRHTCAIDNGKRLFCMGHNTQGQLGIGSREHKDTPQRVTGFSGADSGVTSMCAGGYHTCAVAGSKLWCWGLNYNGQLGNGSGDRGQKESPQGVDLSAFPARIMPMSVSCGHKHTCATFSDSKVRCWGHNSNGQIGVRSETTESTLPLEVDFPNEENDSVFPRVVTCGSIFSCALLSDDTVSCWGANSKGELGIGPTNGNNHYTPQKTVVIENVVSLHNGGGHCCALVPGSNLYCWGQNNHGQLGLGDTTYRHTPEMLPRLDGGVVHVSAGSVHTCFVTTTSGTVWCWGYNYSGQLALGYSGHPIKTSPTKTLFTPS